MSYINEALKKAQKNKDTRHADYVRSIGKEAGEKRFPGKKYLYFTLMVLCIFLFLSYSGFNGPSERDQGHDQNTVRVMQASESNQVNQNLPDMDKKGLMVNSVTEDDSYEEEIINQIEALYKKAVSFFEKGKTQVAENIFREILELDPGHVNSLNDMGVLSLQQGKYDNAISYLEKAVKLKPDYVNPYYNLACTYSLQNKKEEGMAYLKRAMEIDEKVKDWVKNDPDLKNLKQGTELMVFTR